MRASLGVAQRRFANGAKLFHRGEREKTFKDSWVRCRPKNGAPRTSGTGKFRAAASFKCACLRLQAS